MASSFVDTNYFLYAHEEMCFCKNWDLHLENEIKKFPDNLFYLTGTNVSVNNALINFDCGSAPENFDEKKFNEFCKNDLSKDLQGSHWAPHLIHLDLWKSVGGFSEEFNPGIASDPDFNMKLWNIGVRLFKGLGNCRVYHFSSMSLRKKTWNNGAKTFLLKWGISIKFFKKHYLKSDQVFQDVLSEPNKSLNYYFGLIKCKISYCFHSIFKKI